VTDGWIKLHRKILDWEWYDDPNTFRLFLHLLLIANHEDKKYRGVLVKRGSVVTGRIKLAEELGLSEREVRTALTKLKSTSEVTSKSTNKFTIVSIINYDKYQQNDQQPVRPATNERPASDHKQELKNEKNVRNNTHPTLSSLTEEVVQEVANHYHVPVSAVRKLKEQMELYCASKGKAYRDYRAALMKWTLARIDEGKIQPLKVTGSPIMEALRKAGRNDI